MSTRVKNPFEYEGANNLAEEDVIGFYIEDYNYSRSINTKRNIFLIGERGSGKTMTLLYNSFKIQYRKAKLEGQIPDFSTIGIYLPCNTPLFHKKEYELLDNEPFKAFILGEHYLTLSLVYHVCEALEIIQEIRNEVERLSDKLIDDAEYYLGVELRKDINFFDSVKRFVAKENIRTQKQINSFQSDGFYDNAYTFSSLVLPLFEIIRKLPSLRASHFLLMIDDAHDLNYYQIRTVNSWIAYRDHSVFSFKIATAKVNRPKLITASGGTILEGHDFITIDMEKPFQNEYSDFYKLAKGIIEKRLQNVGVHLSVEDYFPVNPEFQKDMDLAEMNCKEAAWEKYPNGTLKQITDFIYKYKRAFYFRNRSTKANLPPYSGFQTLVDISTGVIRNLLDPCYHMFESQLDRISKGVDNIPFSIQNKVIIERSRNMWSRLQQGLYREVDGCSVKQGQEILHLFEQLMLLFEKRLYKHNSEPRAISFTISQKEKYPDLFVYIEELLKISQKAQILYTRMSNSKDDGKQEIYYVPNRILFPARSLDPHGQFSRVSLKIVDLYGAATKNIIIPFQLEDNENSFTQTELFDAQ